MVFQIPPTHVFYDAVWILMLPTIVLSWTSLVAPYQLKPIYGMEEIGALVITPREGTVGPSIWLGVFRSCSRFNQSYLTHCDYSSHLAWKPNYDLSDLPQSAPLFTLRVPPLQLRTLAWVTTFFATFLWILSFAMTIIFLFFRAPRPPLLVYGLDITALLESLKKKLRLVYVIGSGFVASVGFINYVLLWVHFKKACDNFNLIYRRPGHPLESEHDIDARIGKVFNLAYGGYILLFVPWLIAFVELHQDRGNWARIFYQPVPAADPDPNNGGNGDNGGAGGAAGAAGAGGGG